MVQLLLEQQVWGNIVKLESYIVLGYGRQAGRQAKELWMDLKNSKFYIYEFSGSYIY